MAVEVQGEALRFTTNVGDVIEAGADHALRIGGVPDGEPRPYLHVRRGLEALIARPVFYELAAMAKPHPDSGVPAVCSNETWFSLEPRAGLMR